jgi:glycosyltransferase involved in cell wall biosynthesis
MLSSTTVVIPCFNGEKYLAEALDSVARQTSRVRNVIVVDDGSARPVQLPPQWLGIPTTVIRTENRGVAAARNTGIAQADGEFVAFLDSDDLWAPQKIERQEEALRSRPDAVACYTECRTEPGFYGFGPYPPSDVSRPDLLMMLWYQAFFPPSAVMVRRSVLERIGGFREGMLNGEDVELWFRLLAVGDLVHVRSPETFYRTHAGQWTTDVYRKFLGGKQARESIIDKHGDLLVAAGIPRNRLWDAYRNEILTVYFRRQFQAARRLLWDYWFDHPRDLMLLKYAMCSLLPADWVQKLRGTAGVSAEREAEQIGRTSWQDGVTALRNALVSG